MFLYKDYLLYIFFADIQCNDQVTTVVVHFKCLSIHMDCSHNRLCAT